MATMKEVAQRAGISVATVSRVINNSAYVEPVTRERVEKAMREFNYHRNAAALALAKRSGNMLGLLTGNLDDPFFARLASGVEEVTRKAGIRLMMCSGGHQADLEKSGLDFLINQGCEAIVAHITRMSDDEVIRYAVHTPSMVIVNRYIPTLANRCVWLDNVNAACAATTLLLEQGHRTIACVTSDLPIADRGQRLEGYKIALQKAGISPNSAWVISVPFNEHGGEAAAKQIIASQHRFTAVVTFNDVMAAGMMRIFHQNKVALPEDISIIGFDNIPFAKYLHPTLTTMHNPVDKMAMHAAKLAIKLNSGHEVPPQHNEFKAKIVHRDSVKNLNN